ncbi:MAG: VacJ family lipoprotein [Alphaproteobacteria bacterium]
MSKKFLLTFLVLFFCNALCHAKPQNYSSSRLPTQKNEDHEFESYKPVTTVKISDPYEKINRKIFAINETFDRYFFEHVAKTYRKTVPNPARKLVRNFLSNLSLPISAVNSFAQGKIDNGLATFSTFLINSTLGVGGLFNIAQSKGITYHFEDLGQTLGYYNLDQGSFLMLPIIGPSTTRDFSGWAIDKAINPLSFNALEIGGNHDLIDNQFIIATSSLYSIDTRESLIDIIDDIRQDSFDPYATIRFAYLQKRAREIQK